MKTSKSENNLSSIADLNIKRTNPIDIRNQRTHIINRFDLNKNNNNTNNNDNKYNDLNYTI